ncbi:dTMP kinase [Acidianus sulfidivorans JP7]|uniref:Probable thymidylate kinase n=1 Tax=Acidianus sulfidivorans JP7 TaxID=619593 RepID=A0A2U9IM17_9CREN|nr:dTMP kinase [Acidianus sulfidivorans]AWR97050.1 dTMP kinase [Acidianus sulfidivorans JP7]
MLMISLEGIDGSGKTSVGKELYKYLETKYKNKKILLTYEPFTKEITNLIQNQGWKDGILLTLLFSADRAVHINWIRQNNPDVVIMDRYYLSTIAYQSVLGVKKEWIVSVNSYFPKPDLTILLDLPSEIAIKRISKSDKFNFNEKIQLLEKVRIEYLELAKEDKNIKIVDASKNFEEVLKEVISNVEKLFS